MLAKHSLSSNIARILLSIMILLIISTGLSIITMINNLNDAEAINTSGSLRMQSYRLAYDIASNSPLIDQHRIEYANSLHTPALTQLDRFYVPRHVRNSYHDLLQHWQILSDAIEQGNKSYYLQQIDDLVQQIDNFVLDIQHYSELKLWVAELIILLGFISTAGLVSFAIWFIRKRIVAPLHQLVETSHQIQKGNFASPTLDTSQPNELGLLSSAFITMTTELAKLYRSLEDKVTEKTQELMLANQSLSLLYNCSRILNNNQPDQTNFQQVLNLLKQQEALDAIQLRIIDNSKTPQILQAGRSQVDNPWYSQPLLLEGQRFGELSWQCAENCQPQSPLIINIAEMLSRSIYTAHSYKQHQQLLLMEERATIARELHDSLAQALSFLRIQLVLLRRNIATENAQTAQILDEFEHALISAYRQLRELLATFRLTIPDADLHEALHQLIKQLQTRTDADIILQCDLPSHSLNAQQQVHTLQIVREAVTNAIKHAKAKTISISCQYSENNDNLFIIKDNGIGIATINEPDGHYGLNIMHERARSLEGTLEITKDVGGGTRIQLTFPQKN